MALQPFDGKLDDSSTHSLTSFEGRLGGEEPSKRTLGDAAKDVGISALKGVIGLPEAAVGIADLATGGYAGKAAEAVGFRPKQAKDMLDEHYSEAQKAANEEVNNTKGFLPTVGAMVRNPSTIVNQALESAPSMILGGAAARGALGVLGKVAPKTTAKIAAAEAAPLVASEGARRAAIVAPIAAGALGEGLVAAGQNAEQVRQEEADGTLSAKQIGYLAGSGLLTGAISGVVGAGANKMGVGDINTMLARGKLGPVGVDAAAVGAEKGLARRLAEGAGVEGTQEVLQSYQEQVGQNLAQDKPWDEGAAEAGAQGMMAGALMGAGGNAFHGNHAPRLDNAGGSVASADAPPAAPPAGPLLGLPAPTIDVDSNGIATNAADRNAQVQQDIEQRLARLARINSGEVTDVTPIERAPVDEPAHTPSQQMGLDPAAGPLSAAAALAVDGGATVHVQTQLAVQQAAEQAKNDQPKGKQSEQVNPDTGEIAPAKGKDRIDELQTRLDFIGQQAAVNGWNRGMTSERDRVQSELDSLQPKAPPAAEQQNTKSRQALDSAKLQKKMRRRQTTPTTPQGDKNGIEAAQTQPPGTQPAQAAAAPAAPGLNGAPAAPAITAVKDVNGKQVHVLTADLNGDKERLRTFTKDGKPRAVSIHRDNLDPIGAKRAANAATDANNPLFNVITAKNGVAFASEATAMRELNKRGMNATHEVVPASEVKSGADGFVVRKKTAPATAQLDAAAHAAATSPRNDLPEPSQAQKDAGNYPKGHIAVNGLDISIENPAGSKRRPEWPALKHHYGYIKGTIGRDKDHVDVFMTDHAQDISRPVFVVDQNKKNGTFDEHKVILGAATEAEARQTYLDNYEKGWTGLGAITQMSQYEFKAWVRDPKKTTQRAAPPRAPYQKPTLSGEESIVVDKSRHGIATNEITVGQLPNGKWASGYKAHGGDQGSSAPVSGEHDTREQAINAAIDKGIKAVNDPKILAKWEAERLAALAKEAIKTVATKPNTIFTEDAAAAARARLKAKLGRLNSGIDPEMLKDGLTLAGFHIERGARTFAAYARMMIDDLGEAVNPYLKSWYMAVKYDPRATGFDGMDSAATIESADIEKVAPKPAPTAGTLTDALHQAITEGNMPKDNMALKKMTEAFDGKPITLSRMKQAQEALEAAIVNTARGIVAKGQSQDKTFEALLKLYQSQPNLNVRTSTSIANQAYSTPAPLAYLADQLAGVTPRTTLYEPTAGNGMLTIGATPGNVHVNELDDARREALKAQGFQAATPHDASDYTPKGRFDAVVMNPPFGPVKDAKGESTKVDVDGYAIGQIDQLIAAKALAAMKDDGRAVLILGANKVAGGLSNDDRIFFNWLYGNYNVTGHFEVNGDLYTRQGAGWPVRVIRIERREKTGKFAPVAGTIQRAENWEQVYEHAKQLLDSAGRPDAGAGAGHVRAGDGQTKPAGLSRPAGEQTSGAGQPVAAGGAGGDGDVAGTGPRAISDRGESAERPMGDGLDEQRLGFEPVEPDRLEPAGKRAKPEPAETAGDSGATALAAEGNQFQAPYVARSSRKDAGILIPYNMAQSTQDALSKLEDAVGDIDEFARKELGYKSAREMHGALMGLQVDSVASAIHQMRQGKAVVIADQTGIGKGRQAAAIIRWAAKQGHIPVFVSVKPSLFTDMYGDLGDIGSHDIRPFIMNGDAWVAGEDGTKLFANKPGTHRGNLERIAQGDGLPGDANALFMTYSQVNVDNTQRRALAMLAPKAVFILDESHNAAGDSATGNFMIDTLGAARGVTYLSATYAKRPDNMPLYFKTDIGEAVSDNEGLSDAMAAGGLPLQTVVSNNLVKAGQMFRRERSYDGVKFESKIDTSGRARHEKMSNEATKALRAIVAADQAFHGTFVKSLHMQLIKQGAGVKDNAGNQASAGVQHTEFSSVVHNFVKQMLLGLKAQTAADEAIASIKRGEKPIIAVENTMGSFLSEYAAGNNLLHGDELGNFDYRTVLSRALERTLAITEKLPNGDERRRIIKLSELDPVTREAYRQAQKVIDGLSLSIPVSPIDWIRAELIRAGHSVAEITGRNLAVDYTDPAKAVLTTIDAGEQKDKVATTRKFNDGRLDALVLNVAGSTGISLHASEKFADQRQRHMIVAQPAGDINIFMQMLGRVHRTGQVALPKYTLLSADLPTEKRPTAVLSIKMKSLNANTSSNTESATSVKSADILNKYGDQIVDQYLADNPALARALGVSDLVGGENATDDIARKATGRLALQPIEVQHTFYDEVEGQYNALIDYLNKTNQNDLEPRTFDFDAQETRSETLFDGPNPKTPFGEDAIYGEYSIKAQGVPMKAAEIQDAIKSSLGEQSPAAHATAMQDELDGKYQAFHARLEDTAKEVADAARNTARAFLESHQIGDIYHVDINGEPMNAVILNVKNSHKATGNPYSLSKFQVAVAVNGALRSLTVPATQFRKIEVSRVAPQYTVDQMFRERPANERETAKIITGNLLAAYGELQGVRGTIITFTKADGTTEQGILLPKAFDYSHNTRGDYRLASGADALKFLQTSDHKDVGRFGIMSRDGVVRVLPSGQGVRIQVPKSKLKGAKYYLDKALLAQTGDFISNASYMVATVDSPKEAAAALDILMKKQALYALPSMADEAKSIVGDKGGHVAQEPTPEYTGGYETDLFGNPVPTTTGKNRPAQPAGAEVHGDVHTAAGDTPAPAGEYLVNTHVATETQRQIGASRVNTPAQAAQATSYLYKSAVERFDGIVTDQAGKVLAVVGGFKGAVTQTSVYPGTLMAEAIRVPGAARIWLSHNHPSGSPELSPADEQLNRALGDVFKGSGIEPMGLMAVAGKKFVHQNYAGQSTPATITRGDIPDGASPVKVPVYERELSPSTHAGEALTSPAVAKDAARRYYRRQGGPGIMMLDAQNSVAGWVPITEDMKRPLRGGALSQVYRAVSQSNASSAIIVHGGELDTTGGLPSSVTTVSQNIAQALSKMDVRPLDSINVKTGQSAAEHGMAIASGPLFSLAQTTDKAVSSAAQGQATELVERMANDIASHWANPPKIVVAFDMNDPRIPKDVRQKDQRQRSGSATGTPEGFYYKGTVYLMASKLVTPQDTARVLLHEALGHAGLRGVFGKSLTPILQQISTMRKAEVDAKMKEYGEHGVNNLDRLTAAEEVLAEMAQTNPQIGFVRRAVAAIRTWLRENVPGLRKMFLSDAEIIRNYLEPARDFVRRGAQGATVGAYEGAPVYSLSAARRYTRTAVDELNKTFSAPGKLNWWHKTVGTMYNLAERSPAFKAVFDSAQGFIDDVSHYANDAAELAPKLLPKLETWRDIAKSPISAADNKAIAKPIFEGTLSWARDEVGKPVRIEDKIGAAEGLSAEQKGRAMLRAGQISEGVLKMWQGLPLEQYEALVASRYESKVLAPGVVWSDAELKSMFKMSDAQVALYHEFRQATNRSLDTMARADMLRYAGDDVKGMREQVMEAADAQEAATLLRDRLIDLSNEMPDRAAQLMAAANGVIDRADKLADLQSKGYAPLSRFGQYTVDVVENGERQYFGLFETKREANEMAERMRQEFGDGSVSQGTLSNEAFKLFAGITPESLELFGNMLGLDATGDGARDQAFQEYLRLTKTNRSAMRRLIHRQGIAGFSEDVGRVLASFVYSNARQTSAGLNMGNMGEAVAAIPKEQGELKDAAVRLSEYIKNPQEEAHAVRGLLFAQYLGGSIASAFVNMTQPAAVSFPWLSQYGGARKAAAELGRAAKQMATRGHRYESDLAKALHVAEEDGTVSPQEVHQLMAQARGAGSLRPGDGTKVGDARAQTQNALARLSMAWGKVFGAAEQANRRMTFIAAYRMAKAQGLADAAAFASKAVKETQFVYSKANKMQWGRGAVGGTLMTFKTYSIAYLEVLHRMYTQGGPEGKKATMLALGMLMLMGGAGGLPFAEDAQELAEGLAQLLGYNISAKKSRQELLEGIFGKSLAEFINSGVSGLPGMPLDVSGRLGMGKLLPGIGLVKDKSSHTRDVLEIAGPAGDFASRILSGGRRLLGGDIGAGLLEMSPQAVRNAAKGVDMEATGMYRDTKGYKVLEANHLEAALKAIGFQPASVANVQESNSINQQAKNFYNLRAQEIRSGWASGIFEGEQSQVIDARAAIAHWNRKNPEQPMIITIPSVMHKVKEMRKPKDQRIADAAPKAMRAQMKADILARAN